MRLLTPDNSSDMARRLYSDAVPVPGYEKHVDPVHDAKLHTMAGREIEGDPMRIKNRLMLVHASLISGRPGYDYSNPYAFLARLYINKPTLVPSYGGGSQSPQSIAVNVAAGNGQLRKRW